MELQKDRRRRIFHRQSYKVQCIETCSFNSACPWGAAAVCSYHGQLLWTILRYRELTRELNWYTCFDGLGKPENTHPKTGKTCKPNTKRPCSSRKTTEKGNSISLNIHLNLLKSIRIRIYMLEFCFWQLQMWLWLQLPGILRCYRMYHLGDGSILKGQHTVSANTNTIYISFLLISH